MKTCAMLYLFAESSKFYISYVTVLDKKKTKILPIPQIW